MGLLHTGKYFLCVLGLEKLKIAFHFRTWPQPGDGERGRTEVPDGKGPSHTDLQLRARPGQALLRQVVQRRQRVLQVPV